MNCFKIFIKKEIREILCSKRLLMSISFGVFFCTFMNVIANIPGSTPMFNMDIYKALLCINLLTLSLGTDIVYVLMVEEVSYGTFDMIRLSRCSDRTIVILKCVLPVVVSLTIFTLSITINNIFALFSGRLIKLSIVDIWYWLWAVLAAIGCNLLELYRCLSSKTTVPANNNVIAFIGGAFYAVTFYFRERFELIMLMLVAVSTYCLFLFTKNVLKRSRKSRKKSKLYLFKIADGNQVRTMISREIIKALEMKAAIFKLVNYLLVLSVMLICIPQSVFKNIIGALCLYLVALVFSGDIYLESIKLEIYENVQDILSLSKISREKNYLYILVSTTLMGIIYGGILFSILFAISHYLGIKFMLFKCLLLYFSVLFISGICAFGVSCKLYKSLKDSKMVKRYVYILNAVLYGVLSIFIL